MCLPGRVKCLSWDSGRPARPMYITLNSHYSRLPNAGGRDARGPRQALDRYIELITMHKNTRLTVFERDTYS